jgi:hypothetical protein
MTIRQKYGAIRTAVIMPNGTKRTFASKREAERYQGLALLEKAGRIRNLELQVSFPLRVNNVLICRYVLDFKYEEYEHRAWSVVFEDVKGYATPAYKLKKRLMLAVHGIEIRET